MDQLLSYLTAQQMVSQQLGFPLLQTGAVPMTVQTSALLQPTVSTAQLIGMNQYLKPAAMPTPLPQNELLLQLLNNNGFGAVALPQVSVAPAPVVEKPAPAQQPQTFFNIFEQLVAANSLQHPLFIDQASALAAMTVSQPAATAPQPVAVTPLNLAAFLPQTTVLPTTTATVLPQPITILQAPPTTVCQPILPSTVLRKPVPVPMPTVPTVSRPAPAPTMPAARAVPVITIDTPEKKTAAPTAFRVVTPAAAAVAATAKSPAALPQPLPYRPEPCSPVKSSPSQLSSADSAAGAATVASTSKSSSVDEEAESVMSEEEERYRSPEDMLAGRQRRADHIAFHRKMKALLKGLRGSDLICKICSVKVERHDNAFKAHIAEHAAGGANQLQCRYCGFETPSRVAMNLHMGEKHPNGSERAYTDKRDHLKMVEIMNECFAKVQRPPKPVPTARKDPATIKPRKYRKRSAAGGGAEAATVSPPVEEPPVSLDEFEHLIARFCSDTTAKEVACACGDEVPLNPSSLLSHVKNLHAMYKCTDCGDVLDSEEEARRHTVKMHGGQEATFAQRIEDLLMLKPVQQRFMACFIQKGATPLVKSHSAKALQAQADADKLKEIEKAVEAKKEIKEEIKDQPEIKQEIKDEPMPDA